MRKPFGDVLRSNSAGRGTDPPTSPSHRRTSTRPWPRWIAIGALCAAVFFIALWQSSADLHTSAFHPDESRWVNRAIYLQELKDPLSNFWQDRYLIRAQPPMGSYLIGLGLLLQGKDLHTNGPWDFQFGFETAITWNVSHGNMPTFDNLIAARQWNMVLGALTCVMLVLIVGMMVNWVGGAIAGLFMAIHPLHIYLSTLAVSDAMFTTMVAFAVLSAIWLARKPTWGRSVLLAVALAMGAATKLSPLLIAVGWSVYAFVLFLDPWLRSRAARWGGLEADLPPRARHRATARLEAAGANRAGRDPSSCWSIPSSGPIRSAGRRSCSIFAAMRWTTRPGSGRKPRSTVRVTPSNAPGRTCRTARRHRSGSSSGSAT